MILSPMHIDVFHGHGRDLRPYSRLMFTPGSQLIAVFSSQLIAVFSSQLIALFS